MTLEGNTRALPARALVSPQQRQVDRQLVERFDPDDHAAGVQREPDPPVIVASQCFERSLHRIDEPCRRDAVLGVNVQLPAAVDGNAKGRATGVARPFRLLKRRCVQRRRRAAIAPARPMPSNASVPGSGTGRTARRSR